MEGQDRESVGAGEPAEPEDAGPTAEQPAKIIRIASMIRELLQEVRQSSLDKSSRERLRKIYERSLTELEEVLSEDLPRTGKYGF